MYNRRWNWLSPRGPDWAPFDLFPFHYTGAPSIFHTPSILGRIYSALYCEYRECCSTDGRNTASSGSMRPNFCEYRHYLRYRTPKYLRLGMYINSDSGLIWLLNDLSKSGWFNTQSTTHDYSHDYWWFLTVDFTDSGASCANGNLFRSCTGCLPPHAL